MGHARIALPLTVLNGLTGPDEDDETAAPTGGVNSGSIQEPKLFFNQFFELEAKSGL
jgi:hypothetical protein